MGLLCADVRHDLARTLLHRLTSDFLPRVRAIYDDLEPMALPRCEVGPGTVPGRSGSLLVQGEEFLAGVDLADAA